MTLITLQELKEIVDLANSVPKEYQEKCFELILLHTLQVNKSGIKQTITPEINETELQPSIESAIKPLEIPLDVKAFLSQYGLDNSDLEENFMITGGGVRPIYLLDETQKKTKQIQLALMMCLEHAISDGIFQTEVESLRKRCNELNCYDSKNFLTNIRTKEKLLRLDSEGNLLSLTTDGKSELADLLEQLKS